MQVNDLEKSNANLNRLVKQKDDSINEMKVNFLLFNMDVNK